LATLGGSVEIGEGEPRSALRLVGGAFALYRRYPLLFLILAAAVIVPYEAIVLALTGTGPFTQSSLDPGVELLLSLADFALIGPLISALHVHAVKEAREGGEPRLGSIARQGLRVLPVVAAVTIVSWLGIIVGFVALIIPGIYLLLRWFVVAQAAAIEDQGWLPALRRSGELVEGHFRHVFVVFVCMVLIVDGPAYLIGLGFDHESTSVISFLVGSVVLVFAYSFSALITALLYYDLRLRQAQAVAPRLAGDVPPTGHSQDPRNYTSENRPKGWYVDPRNPRQMRYWDAGDPPDWSGTARTPRKARRAWEQESRGESRPDS
jgi:hypothetical protein